MKTYNISCPICQNQSEVESIFTVRVGDKFACNCGKELTVKILGNPLQMEEFVLPKSFAVKEKK